MEQPTLFDFYKNNYKSSLLEEYKKRKQQKYSTNLNDKINDVTLNKPKRRKQQKYSTNLNDKASIWDKVKLAFKNDPLLKFFK